MSKLKEKVEMIETLSDMKITNSILQNDDTDINELDHHYT